MTAFLLTGIKMNHHKELRLHDFSIPETLPYRGGVAIAVMLCHLCPYLMDRAPLLSYIGNWGNCSVPVFFLLAGYGLAISYFKKGDAYLDGFFRRRLLRLIGPFALMTVIYQLYRCYNRTFDWISSLQEPFPKSWFIYALLICYVGFYLSYKLGNTLRQKQLLLLCFMGVYLIITVSLHLNYYYSSILVFPMAILYVPYEESVKRYLCLHPWKVWTMLFVTSFFILGYAVWGEADASVRWWGMPAYNYLPWIVVYMVYIYGGWKNKVTNFLGRISYEFYIAHGFIVMLLGHIQLLAYGYVNALSVILIVMTATIAGALMLKYLSSKLITNGLVNNNSRL